MIKAWFAPIGAGALVSTELRSSMAGTRPAGGLEISWLAVVTLTRCCQGVGLLAGGCPPRAAGWPRRAL